MTLYTPLIIIFMLLLNFLLKKKNLLSKNLFRIITVALIGYILLSITIYCNNISLGYKDGILFGDIVNTHFCDEYKYFTDSQILHNHFINGDFSKWINKQLPVYEFVDPQNHPSYGNYNFFVLVLTGLRMLGITSVLDFILIKLLVFIPTAIFLYKLSRIYLNEKLSLIAVVIFSLLPGYILTNVLLMRDNIIILIITLLLYYILSKKCNLYVIIPSLVLLFMFRSYVLLVLIATIIFTFKNTKRIISFKDILYLSIIIITIYFFTNYSFSVENTKLLFSYAQIKNLQDTFINTYGTGIPMLIKLFTSTGIHIVVDPLFINFYSSGSIYLILLALGNLLGIVISGLFAIKFLILAIKNKSPKTIYLLKFTVYFTLLNGLIIMAKDTFILNRLALMWLPLFIIILLFGIRLPKKTLK